MKDRQRTPSTGSLAAIEYDPEQNCGLCNGLMRRIVRDCRMRSAVFCAEPQCTENRGALLAEELAGAARAS